MTINKITNKGFITEKPVDETNNLVIEGSGETVFNQDVVFSSGISNYSQIPKYQVFNLANQSFTGSTHGRIRFQGQAYSGSRYLENIWDFTNHKFVFSGEHQIYTIRLDGIIPTAGVSGDPTFHVDFEVSGAISTTAPGSHANETIHRQTIDTIIRTQGPQGVDHAHFHAVFIINTDAQLVASGAQLYVATSGQSLQFTSGTLMIKEG
jgi:hypothetical protein